MLKGLFRGNSHTNGNGTHRGGVVAPPYAPPADGGKLIVLTAPLTETIDHAGYFIQMALASLPIWMEFVINDKYPPWRKVEHNADGTARYMPAGVRLVEKSLLREFRPEDMVVCYPDDLDKFLGPRTRVVVSQLTTRWASRSPRVFTPRCLDLRKNLLILTTPR